MTIAQTNKDLPLVTIVTPSYNQGCFIEDTIQSVISQDYPNIEYIIIDGGSTDNTLAIIKQYQDKISKWVSEPDEGQSDAINKGWQMASGDFVAWINSDDSYMPGAVRTAMDVFAKKPEIGLVYGNALKVDQDGNPLGIKETRQVTAQHFLWFRNFVPQPTAFINIKVLKKVGFLNPQLHMAMDYDLFYRIARAAPIYYIPQVLAKMRLYSETKTNLHTDAKWKERLNILKKYNRFWYLSGISIRYLIYFIGKNLPDTIVNNFRKIRKLPRDQIKLEE